MPTCERQSSTFYEIYCFNDPQSQDESNREFGTRRQGDICGDCDATKGNLKRPNINFTRKEE